MNGDYSTQQEFLAKITAIIEANLQNEQFGVNELASAMGMSRITLHRKIKSAAGISISQFISQVRLKKAFELLKQNSATISEVAYDCGFHSVSYFSKCFHDYYGFPPGEAKNHDSHGTNEKPETETPIAKPAGKRKWTRVAFAVAIALIATIITSEVFFFRPFTKEKESAENTIAIIPFVNDSGEEFAPFTTWMGIEIGNKLSKIENMLVVPQSTMETYRDSKKSNRDIALELMVDHLLRGRTIKTGNKILLNVELFDANNGNAVFTEMFERDLNETEEADLNRIFEICGDVVFQITEALKTDLTTDEKEQITKKSTENMAAVRAYQEATQHAELSQHSFVSNPQLYSEELNKAKNLLIKAIIIDSVFTDAYILLGHVYINCLYNFADIYLADKYLDTGKIYLDKALQLDKTNNPPAGYLRQYYILKGMMDEAEKWLPYIEKWNKSFGYFQTKYSDYMYMNDLYHKIEAFFNYMKTKPVDIPPPIYMLYNTYWDYMSTGFHELAKKMNDEILKEKHDTLGYLIQTANIQVYYGSKDSTLKLCYQIHNKYPSFLGHLFYGVQYYNYKGEHAKALDTLKKLEEKVLLIVDSIMPNFYVNGYTYLKNGMKENADYHFKGSIKLAEDEIKLHSDNARRYISHFNLALIYAILNDKQKSFQYLEMIKKSPSITLNFINDLKNNPMFDNVRSEPDFQKITRELEKKYNEEHEKIKKLLIRHKLEPA